MQQTLEQEFEEQVFIHKSSSSKVGNGTKKPTKRWELSKSFFSYPSNAT